MKKHTHSILVASLGGFDLSIPTIRIGSGSPKVLIMANIHGDELTGMYVLEAFLRTMPTVERGALTIVPTANAFGLLHKQRTLPIDNVDLNRGYPIPEKERGIQTTVKTRLLELCMEHDIVVDLHTFQRPTLSAGLELRPHANTEVAERVGLMLRALGNEITLVMETSGGEEQRVSSALAAHLIRMGKTAIGVEYPPIRQCADARVIHDFAAGLARILTILGMTDKKINSDTLPTPPVLARRSVMTRTSALFEPAVSLRDMVRDGDMLGYLIDPMTLARTPLASPYTGMMTEIADRNFYVVGEKIATIGVPAE